MDSWRLRGDMGNVCNIGSAIVLIGIWFVYFEMLKMGELISDETGMWISMTLASIGIVAIATWGYTRTDYEVRALNKEQLKLENEELRERIKNMKRRPWRSDKDGS